MKSSGISLNRLETEVGYKEALETWQYVSSTYFRVPMMLNK